MSSALSQFRDHKYVSLETYKKSGQAVPTPVWFCIDQDVMYVSAPAHTGKVKRIRNNPQVRIAVCDGRGKVQGPWVAARARFADDVETQHAEHLLDRRYGWQRAMIHLWSKFRGWRSIILAIDVGRETPR